MTQAVVSSVSAVKCSILCQPSRCRVHDLTLSAFDVFVEEVCAAGECDQRDAD